VTADSPAPPAPPSAAPPARRVLVAEDDASMRRLFVRILAEEGYEVEAAEDGIAAIARLARPFDLVVTDLKMPGADGMQVLEATRRKHPGTPVVVITAFGSIPGAVDAMRLGAFDYLAKPLSDPRALREVARRALEARAGAADAPSEPIAEDPAMKRVVEQARRVAPRDTTVLLLGESGTGKEVIARLLHAGSPRRAGPFVAVNCAALTESLLESELFGHERGAFTGATARHEGRFEQADGGTLFLDEIGETSAALQAKLLRVLQEHALVRVGGEQQVSVDVRVIAATNRDLGVAVASGAFREDLYYRLAVFPIQIPPLRERRADILPLAEHFLALLSRGASRTPPSLSREARELLQAHRFPGNVRELENVIERALILSGGGPISPEELGLGSAPRTVDGDVGAAAIPGADGGAGTLKEMERRAILAALEAEDGNRRRAARRLGIALRTLQYKIKDYEIK
jgi:two-component system, NtrC family, response regulator AtoC